jgi:hypothetical protein
VKLSSKPMPNPAVIFRELDGGEAVLVNTDTTASIVLNATGMAVWRWMDGARSLDEIVALVRRQFQGVPDSVASDVQQLLEVLAEEGFVGYELLSGET